MGIHAAGANQGINPSQQSQSVNNANDLISLIQNSKDDLVDALNDLKEEMKAPSTKKELGQTSESQGNQATQEAEIPVMPGHVPDHQGEEATSEVASAFASAVQGQDEVDKKKKKKKFEEKLEMLAKLEGKFDLSQLEEDEKEIVEQFFQNLNTIKKFKGKLKYLEDQEIYYTGLLEQQKQSGR